MIIIIYIIECIGQQVILMEIVIVETNHTAKGPLSSIGTSDKTRNFSQEKLR